MLARPLTATVTLGILVFGAAVGLEAVGVLFQVRGADPEQRTDGFLAQLDAGFDSMIAPGGPVDLPDEFVEDGAAGHDAERLAADPPQDAASEAVENRHPTDHSGSGTAAAVSSVVPQSPVPEEVRPKLVAAKAPPPAAVLPPTRPAIQEPEPEPVVVQPAVRAAGPASPRPQRLAKHQRARSARASPDSVGCPLLDWLNP